MKAFFSAAVLSESNYNKWKVNEPGVFCLLFYVQSREYRKQRLLEFAWVARKHSRHLASSEFYSDFHRLVISVKVTKYLNPMRLVLYFVP